MSDRAIEMIWRLGAVAFFVGFFPLCVGVGLWINRHADHRLGIVPGGTGYNLNWIPETEEEFRARSQNDWDLTTYTDSRGVERYMPMPSPWAEGYPVSRKR